MTRNDAGRPVFRMGARTHRAPREKVTTDATTVDALVAELSAREERYAVAFSDRAALRVALDQKLSTFDAPLAGVREWRSSRR